MRCYDSNGNLQLQAHVLDEAAADWLKQNMPSTPEAIAVYQDNGLLYGPAKAANAGGVAVSGLEMSQNSYRLSWTFEEVDNKLKSIMENIVANSLAAAKEYGHEGDLMLGANAAGFVKVANAMVAQGVL